MKKNPLARNYAFTDALLILNANEKIAFMKKDAAIFEGYGITTEKLTALEEQVTAFANLETDIEVKGSQAVLTVAKKEKARAIKEALQNIMAFVALVFKKGTPQYSSFGTHDITHQKEADLYVTALLVVKLGTKYLPELSLHGVTAAHLEAISVLKEEYLELIIDQRTEKVNRQIIREDRIALGNKIYDTLQQYRAVGLSYWETRSSARYNDYLLYPGKRDRKLRIA